MASSGLSFSATVSLLHNNLASSSTGWVAAVHNSVNDSGGSRILLTKLGGPFKDGPQVEQAMSIRYIELPGMPILALSSTNGTQFYNDDATTLLFYAPLTDLVPNVDALKYHQGACYVPTMQHIVVGTSKGSLVVTQACPPDFVALPEAMAGPEVAGVADVCYCAATNAVVSAHDNGELRIWALNLSGSYDAQHVIPAVGQAPCRVGSLGNQILVAFGAGTLCLFNAVTFELQAEVTAHARWLHAAHIWEDLGFVATVGEDTILNVWQVDGTTGRVGLEHSSVVTDKLLTGVSLSGSEALVTSYDSSEISRVAFGS